MKYLPLLLILLTVQIFSQDEEQVTNQNQILSNSIYNNAPEQLQHEKPFVREWVFFQQRAYPNNTIPPNAYENSISQLNQLKADGMINQDYPWVSLGPTPGAYFNYGNISSRILTGAFNPQNPNIIYIGAANGGVWRSTDGGIQWQPLTDNQPSMAMGAIAIDPDNPNIIYAGTGEATYSGASYSGLGLLKSTDGGDTWTQITTGFPANTYFSRIKIRPGHNNEIFASMGYSGLFRSTDSGLTWAAKYGSRIDDIVFSPSGDTLFAIGGGTGLIRSTDGGVTFSFFGSGLPEGWRIQFDLCKSNPSVMYAAIYSNSSGNVTVYKSSNYGANWNQLVPSYDFNGGQAWYDLYCRVNPYDANDVFVGTIDVYRSTNGGTSFSNITNGYSGGSVHVDQHYLFFHPSDMNTLIVSNDGGIYKSTNNGNSFINMNQNLTLTQFYRIAASPFDPGRILGGTQDNGTQQTYSTINWAAAFGGDGGEVCFNPVSQNYIIGETQNGGLTRTINNGASWISGTGGIDGSENAAWVAPIINDVNNPSVFYTARQKVYKSTNNGGSWQAVSGNMNGTYAVTELAISKTTPSLIYCSTGQLIFKSTDGGSTWASISAGLPNRAITSIYVHPNDSHTVFVTFSGFGTGKVFKSTDQGIHWNDISGNLPDSPVNDIYIYTGDASNPSTYFAASDIGVFMTRNDGQNWVELANGIPNTVVLHLDYSDSTHMLRAGTHGRGVYETFIDLATPVELTSFKANQKTSNNISLAWSTATETNNKGFEIERKLKNDNWILIGFVQGKGTTTLSQNYSFNDDISKLKYDGRILYRLKQIDFDGTINYSNTAFADVNYMPESVELFQNYPNPFNPTTTIKYAVPYEANVKLVVYNSIGQKAAELVNELQNPGYHQVMWDAGKFSSGLYIYTLQVQGSNGQNLISQTKKLILMK